ncbi:hypothetical protein CSW59_06950 [Caulobacter sp. BP25]|nr:hypothetical protein CSW59_06950 [Caulobacter sp. BP25]
MAMAGAGLYGLYLFAIKTRSGGQLTRKDLNWLLLNVVCAVLSGLLLTFVFADRLVGFIPWASLRDVGLVAFAFGVFGWELLPLMFPKALRWAENAVDKAGGAQ